MLNWNLIEKAIKEKNNHSGYMNHILSSIKMKSLEIRETSVFLSLIVPNFIVKEICEREIASEIELSIQSEHKKNLVVEYFIENTQQSFPLELTEDQETATVKPIAEIARTTHFEFKAKYALNPRMTFSKLIQTQENDFSQKALQYFAENFHSDTSCAALFGPSGVGKTHLLHAVGWYLLSLKPHLKIKVVSGDEFINDFQTAIFSKTMGEFRNKYRLKTDVLLIDDLQSIEKAKGTQAELFNLLNEFTMSGRKMIMTSDKKITELFGLDERLKSRFLGGLVLNLELPSATSKMTYFESKLSQHGLNLNENLKEAVFSHFGLCYRSIEGALSRLEMLKKINGSLESETVLRMFPLIKNTMGSQLSVDAIINEICMKHQMIKADLIGPSRKREIFLARKEAIQQIRNNLNLSLKEIAQIFNRDHTSILNALKN